VKVLLRNTLNGWFYQGPSKWTPRQPEALDLGQSAWAVEIVFEERLENVEILLCYDDPRYDMTLPVQRHSQKSDTAELDFTGEPFLPGEESSQRHPKKKPSLE
jgi:hypothetical protein